MKNFMTKKDIGRFIKCVILLFCIMICSTAGLFCYAAEQPIFVFDYQGSHIETYSSYSIVDGKVSETHRYFVQSGNLVVIDQNLKPTARDIFIYFEGGRSYIAVLTRNGQMVSLGTEDLVSKLSGFSNRNIAAITNNINTSSKTLIFTYKDGSTAAYDCTTGKLLSGSPATEKKSISEYAVDYMTDLFERSTQGFADTSGAMAESVVRTLEESGASLETLMDAGLAEDIENTYQQAEEMWDGQVYELSKEFEEVINSLPPAVVNTYLDIPDEEIENFFKEYLDGGNYKELMEKAMELLSKDQLVELRDLFARLATGNLSAQEAAGRIALIRPEENVDTPEANNNASKNTLEEYRQSIEDVKAALLSIEKEQEEKRFIQSSLENKFLAVYNAKEKRYDIYSQESLMKKPDNLISEASKLSDTKNAEALNRLLAGDKGDAAQSGVRFFAVITVSIIAILVALLVIISKNTKNKKKSYE